MTAPVPPQHDGATAPRVPAPLTYRPHLDGLRAIAVGVVLMQHLPLPHAGNLGTFGVDTFFVLSGFLITTLMLDEDTRRGAVGLGRFYGRRALRLLPALYSMLAVVGVFALLTPDGELASILRNEIAAAGTYVYNIAALNGLREGWLYHCWSLSLEEQFYLLWPLVLVLFLRRGRVAGAMWFAWGFVAAVAASRLAGWNGPGGILGQRPDALVVGCAIALTIRRLDVTTPSFRRAAGAASLAGVGVWALVAAVGVALPESDFVSPYLRVLALPFALASGAWIVGLVHAPAAVFAPLASAPATAVGKRAYGIYLWHLPAFKALNEVGLGSWPTPVLLGVKVVAGLALAGLSFVVIESPALRLKARFAS